MTNAESARAENLTPAEIDGRLGESSIVYLPLGTLEFHGPHLPIGLDAMTAHGVCLRAAAESGGIVFPPMYQGTGGGHGHYPWTIMMSKSEGIEGHLWETLVRLQDFGVRQVVIFSGHFAPEQLDLMDALAEKWNSTAAAKFETIEPLEVKATAVNRCSTAPLAPDHAGEFETTLLAGIAPDLIHLDRLPSLADAPAPAGEDPYGEQRHSSAHPLWGIFGPDPRHTVLEDGQALLNHLGSWLASIATLAQQRTVKS